MKKKHYVLLICLLLILTLAVLYLRRNPSTHGDGIREIVAEASPPPSKNILFNDDGKDATATIDEPAPEEKPTESPEPFVPPFETGNLVVTEIHLRQGSRTTQSP